MVSLKVLPGLPKLRAAIRVQVEPSTTATLTLTAFDTYNRAPQTTRSPPRDRDQIPRQRNFPAAEKKKLPDSCGGRLLAMSGKIKSDLTRRRPRLKTAQPPAPRSRPARPSLLDSMKQPRRHVPVRHSTQVVMRTLAGHEP